MRPLAFRSPLAVYERQAADLLALWCAGDEAGVKVMRENLARFLDERVPWLPRDLSDAELRATSLELADAQLALARWYSFRDWPSLAEWVSEITRADSPVDRFESAVEALISGDVPVLKRLLSNNSDLVHARSTILTHYDPPRHAATLLHYTAANGVENHRQKTPANAVEIARLLLEAGAEPDALAAMYGGQHTTLSMLVSSVHPAQAGVQVALVEVLLDFGAAVDGRGAGRWASPLMTALAFGYLDTAQALAQRGAAVDTLPAAAGLGQLAEARRRLTSADPESRHKALALAAQHGHTAVVRLLLDAGEDPNRYNPDGNHSHSTPLHQAVWSNHADTVRLLIERGARPDIRDTLWHATPLGWAEHGGRMAIAAYLRERR
jgi:ankyrin repeat protein